jgi:hypothetical protein
MDLVGVRALRRWFGAGGGRPAGPELLQMALAGDLVANTLYYAAVDAPTEGETWRRAAVLGVAAGVGALVLPQPMGLGHPPHSDRVENQAMTVAWYVMGALAAAVAANAARRLSNATAG